MTPVQLRLRIVTTELAPAVIDVAHRQLAGEYPTRVSAVETIVRPRLVEVI